MYVCALFLLKIVGLARASVQAMIGPRKGQQRTLTAIPHGVLKLKSWHTPQTARKFALMYESMIWHWDNCSTIIGLDNNFFNNVVLFSAIYETLLSSQLVYMLWSTRSVCFVRSLVSTGSKLCLRGALTIMAVQT